jgi:Domain of unknown function (DUF4265)
MSPERRALCPLRSGRMSERGRKDVVHSDPVWRERADFIIGAPLHEEGRAEQLWARRLDEPLLFEICCIPFFLYDVALGDVVQTDASSELARVVEPSGRFVFRAWFGDPFHPRQEIADQLDDIGALLEWSSTNLLAVDAADAHEAQVVADFLSDQEDRGHLKYETGHSA